MKKPRSNPVKRETLINFAEDILEFVKNCPEGQLFQVNALTIDVSVIEDKPEADT